MFVHRLSAVCPSVTLSSGRPLRVIAVPGILGPAEHSMGALQAWEGSTGAPEWLRMVQNRVSFIPPKLVHCTKKSVCRLVHHQALRGPSTHQTRCALVQTIVCHEPLRFSESFYVATYFRFGPEDHTGDRISISLYIPGHGILITWVPTDSWM